MKKFATLLIAIGLVVGFMGSPAFAGDNDAKASLAKQRLVEMFELCRKGDWAKLCPYIIYRGPDQKRRWKGVADASNPDDLKAVTGIGMKIKGYLDESDSIVYKKFVVEREPEGEWGAWFVDFKKGPKAKQKIFAFLIMKGKYCLGDID